MPSPDPETEYSHPYTDEPVMQNEISKLSDKEQIDLLTKWFHSNYTESEFTPSPDEDLPTDPHAVIPRDELDLEFGPYVSDEVINAVVQDIAGDRAEWVSRGC